MKRQQTMAPALPTAVERAPQQPADAMASGPTEREEVGASANALNPAITTWLRLMRVHTRIAGRLSALLGVWGLSLAQFDALAQIWADEGLRQQDLAAR